MGKISAAWPPPVSHFPDRFLTAILFIDVVGSTLRAAELGDGKGTELMDTHNSLVRTEIARWGGHEVDAAGDGSFATFDIPARAIGCAWTIARRDHRLAIQIRAGVHAGECERQDGNVRGLAVHTGARIAAKARPGRDPHLDDRPRIDPGLRDPASGPGFACPEGGPRTVAPLRRGIHRRGSATR